MGRIGSSSTLEAVNKFSYDEMVNQAYTTILSEKQSIRNGAKSCLVKKLNTLAKRFNITKKLLVEMVKSVHGDDIMKLNNCYEQELTKEDYKRIAMIKKHKRLAYIKKKEAYQEWRAEKYNKKLNQSKRLKSFLK